MDSNLVELEATRVAEKEALALLREQAASVGTQVEEAAERILKSLLAQKQEVLGQALPSHHWTLSLRPPGNLGGR